MPPKMASAPPGPPPGGGWGGGIYDDGSRALDARLLELQAVQEQQHRALEKATREAREATQQNDRITEQLKTVQDRTCGCYP